MDSIFQLVAEHPYLFWIIVWSTIWLIVWYYYPSEDKGDPIEVDTYDIRCTLPGQLQIVFQDIPEGDFNIDYNGIVYVERDWKSHYLPLQYTTILPNE